MEQIMTPGGNYSDYYYVTQSSVSNQCNSFEDRVPKIFKWLEVGTNNFNQLAPDLQTTWGDLVKNRVTVELFK